MPVRSVQESGCRFAGQHSLPPYIARIAPSPGATLTIATLAALVDPTGLVAAGVVIHRLLTAASCAFLSIVVNDAVAAGRLAGLVEAVRREARALTAWQTKTSTTVQSPLCVFPCATAVELVRGNFSDAALSAG